MLEPVAIQDIMAAAVSGAGVVFFGALYALSFALYRIQKNRSFMLLAMVAYAALAGSVMVLARTLHLDGFWQSVVAVMLIGYLAGPYGVWKLCVGTHRNEQTRANRVIDARR